MSGEQYEYAVLYHETQLGGDRRWYVEFYWNQGAEFVDRARQFFGEEFEHNKSSTALLSVKHGDNRRLTWVLAFLGSERWEVVGFSYDLHQDHIVIFKRPYGHSAG